MEDVFLTTLNTDDYLIGVLLLAKNIRELCKNKLVVLVTNDLKKGTYKTLERFQIEYITTDKYVVPNHIVKGEEQNSYYSHWVNTLFKLKIFDLIQYRKIVYIDSDMLVLQPLDELFEKENMSAVIAGKSYPGNEEFRDLNSGVLVFYPQRNLSDELIRLVPVVAGKKQYFGDQDILAEYFTDWKEKEYLHLPEEYNVFWRYYDFYDKHFSIKIVHFIGKNKPWMMTRIQIMQEYMKCILMGRFQSVKILKQYRSYIKGIVDSLY